MDRRELIKTIAVLTGAAFVGGDLFLSGCREQNKALFSQEDIAFFDEVAETIIPRTDTPGAKDAEVGKFMVLYASDCYDIAQQQTLQQGITQINNTAKKKFRRAFVQLTTAQKLSLLTDIQEEARRQKARKDAPVHYFTLMKQLTLLGFFTSEAGATQVLRHLPVPGTYHGCVDYNGETAWG
ncbi:gluconate 2-dehydrogenase subunit 3 family protein [Chitinophaga oryzae]|uniref:Gluconate 2-dehydrogenase subunit 3 family protein n=1 Tax=Chitinophaga oryzae TaxID=2725414 RepID=A0AAE6ZBE3_9BACT|nr:gluconate 2-dehydrogenase subunit 3 family protein [Chitinophaga oryzae]QJB29826.1 gluconate 2-dehydrogenase subunit 3 family protein [Chitinophaga oryzae]QJB36382.1 gluconate 2-dehydrogenase subunit 3 family protein [Chitinophaga oryzae]